MEDYMKKLIIVWLAIFAFSSTANAGLLVEPFAGYDFSMSGEHKTSAGATTEVKFSNFEVGGRLGWIFNWLGLGIEFDWKNPNWEFNDGTKFKTSVTNFGAFLGLYLGKRAEWMVRGKYIFMGKAKSDKAAPSPFVTELKGTGYGVDLGYRFLHWLALNVEYTMNTYDDPGGINSGDETKTSDLLVSLSFPLEFPFRNSRR
jgi:hypothetical protein